MTTPDTIHAEVERLAALHRDLLTQQQQIRSRWSEMKNLESIRQAWDRQVTWREGLQQPWEELHRLQARLEDKRRRWESGSSADQPEQQLERLQESLQAAQHRWNSLRTVQELAGSAADLVQQWQALREKSQLLDRIETARRDLQNLQSTEPELVEAFKHLRELEEQVQSLHRKRQEIAQLARRLGQDLSDEKPDEWAELALRDLDHLSLRIGEGLARLGEKVESEQEQAAQAEQTANERDAAMAPLRERVQALEAQVQKYERDAQNRQAELAAWGESRIKLGLPDMDPLSEDDLTACKRRLEAELRHLQWFSDVVNAKPKEDLT